jgi:hypothetical protein
MWHVAFSAMLVRIVLRPSSVIGAVLPFAPIALVALALSSGCTRDRPERGGSGETAAGARTNIAPCDEFLASYEGCLAKLPPAERPGAETAWRAQREAFEESAKAAITSDARRTLEGSCANALSAMRERCK